MSAFGVLGSWRRVLATSEISVPWSDFETLLCWATQRGFFSDPTEAFSEAAWSCVNDHLVQEMMAGGPASVKLMWHTLQDVARAAWGSEPCSSAGSRKDLSVSDGDERESELLSDAEASSASRRGELEDDSASEGGGWSSEEDRSLTPRFQSGQPGGGVPRVSGGPGEAARLTRPAPNRGVEGQPSSPCAFPALGGDEGPLDQCPVLFGSDLVTTLCSHCGKSTTYSLRPAEAGSPASDSGPSRGGTVSPVSEPEQPAGHAQAVEAAGGGALVGARSRPIMVGGMPASLCTAEAESAAASREMGRVLLGAVPTSLVPPRADVAPRAASLPVSRPSPARETGGSASGWRSVPAPASTAAPSAGAEADGAAGGAAGSAPQSPSSAGAAARQGAGVFTFSATADAASGKPVFSRGRRSSLPGVWTLPPCQVTVRPKDPRRFWGEVGATADEMREPVSSQRLQDHGGGSSGSAGAAGDAGSSAVAVPRSQAAALVPVGPTGRDTAGIAALPEGPQAFPVIRGLAHNTYEPLPFKTKTKLRETVARHGLGSSEVMHMLRMISPEVRTPADVRDVARALFDPVQFGVFETKWARLAATTAQHNATLGPQDPRRVADVDMLMGTGNYTEPQGQAGFSPSVLEQCQALGMSAVIQTVEMAAPRQPFATIVQKADEPFMTFVGRLTASVERQLTNPLTREAVIADLARSNCTADCKRVIDALPGGATVSQMTEACSVIGPPVQKMAAWATAAQPVWAAPQGWQKQQGNAQGSKKRGKKEQKEKIPMFLCGRCGRPNHMTNVCKATVHANGQALPGSGNGKRSAKGRRAQTQASLQTLEPMEVCSVGLQPAPAAQRV
ncbi:uncharacterized protein LOC120497088 [Passer montanus]|uniref:uncharacterized protein LOC120497088 n=1 Tax=Passer montanus TaxID=9160 RepID=UPI0019604E23|nr:uncharacterized protein LOC120497088 [Passer montanus]